MQQVELVGGGGCDPRANPKAPSYISCGSEIGSVGGYRVHGGSRGTSESSEVRKFS